MTLSPRQISAYLEFSDKLDRIERALALSDTATATRSDPKEIDKKIKDYLHG